jgi:signal transduction histidine kinase
MHPSAVAPAPGRPVENFLLKLQKANGDISWLSISAMPTFEPGRSAPLATVVTIQDITDQKSKEEKIRSQEVSLMLASRLSGLGEMAAGIAHEINNPLAIISGRISILNQTLSDDKLDVEQIKKSLNSIEQTVFRIAKIVASMKSLSRQVSNDHFTKCSMMKILDDVVEISRERLKEARISLILTDNPDVEFDCHPGLIGQAILNLTNNSIDAILKLDAKWIRISFAQEDTFLVLRVTDSGKGIPPALRVKILEPFFTTKEIGKGTGLGLSLVQTIARSHYGEFFINEESQNTEFVLKLPMSQAVKNNT